MSGRYSAETLLHMFRKAAALRNEMVAAGFTDNGGAVHSASRILDILCQRLCYPGLTHINNYRRYPAAEFSDAAWTAHQEGQKVLIEHVAPLRALTVAAIGLIDEGASDIDLAAFLRKSYRLVLLTEEEMLALNRRNRSALDPNRISHIAVSRLRASTTT